MSHVVPLPQVIASAKMLLGLTSSDEDNFLYKLASDAARLADCNDTVVLWTGYLPIQDYMAILPCGTVLINSVRFYATVDESIANIPQQGYFYPSYMEDKNDS